MPRWRFVLGLPLGVAIVAAGVSLVLPPRYTATATFTPESGKTGSGLIPGVIGGLAGQLLTGVTGDAADGPRFYAELAKSRTILEGILTTPYPGLSSGQTMMTALFRVRGRTGADSLADGVRKLRSRVATSVDLTTNLVTITVDAPTAVLAAAVANRFVTLLNQFNAERRQSRAQKRRQFVEGRVAASHDELRAAEAAVKGFLRANRSYDRSPDLVFEFQALERRVAAAQEVYLTLLREFETSRIEEVNDTPVLTLVDSAVAPRKKARPRRVLIVLLSGAIAGATSVLLAAVAGNLAEARSSGAPDYIRVRQGWAAIRSDIAGFLGRRPSYRPPTA